jgi:TorA maturation chaperone TorD
MLMTRHTHNFVETYEGLVGFGLNRETDENTIVFYLQKFSDDTLMQAMRQRMSDEELGQLFELISSLLRKHLTEPEYHRLFLKEEENH